MCRHPMPTFPDNIFLLFMGIAMWEECQICAKRQLPKPRLRIVKNDEDDMA